MRSLARSIGIPLLVLGALILLWEVAARGFAIPGYILPLPSAIFVDTAAMGPVILKHTMATLFTILLGFGISIVISIPLAIGIASSPFIANTLYPILVISQSAPKVALAPIIVVILGAGELSRVVVTVLVAFFPLVLSTATGLLAVPSELIELSRSFSKSRFQCLYRVKLPFAVPFIFSGLKVAITFAVVGAVVGEFVAADRGLGYQIISATAFFRTTVAFGALALLSLLGIVLFEAIVLLERWAFPWSARQDVR